MRSSKFGTLALLLGSASISVPSDSVAVNTFKQEQKVETVGVLTGFDGSYKSPDTLYMNNSEVDEALNNLAKGVRYFLSLADDIKAWDFPPHMNDEAESIALECIDIAEMLSKMHDELEKLKQDNEDGKISNRALNRECGIACAAVITENERIYNKLLELSKKSK